MESKHLQMIAHGLVLVAIMLGLIAAALWFRPYGIEAQAQAQFAKPGTASSYEQSPGIPDAGKQRLVLNEQLDNLNRRVADIEVGLKNGTYVIQTIEAKSAKNAKDAQ